MRLSEPFKTSLRRQAFAFLCSTVAVACAAANAQPAPEEAVPSSDEPAPFETLEASMARVEALPGWRTASARLKMCGTCHSFDENVQKPMGPNLHSVFGRARGKSEFPNYSDDYAALEGVWDDDALDSLLLSPTSISKRSLMSGQPPVRDEEVRQAMIEYLKALQSSSN